VPDFSHLPSKYAILLLFVPLAVVYGLVVPPFENLDEIEHLEVIRYVAETGRLPVHGTVAAETYHYSPLASYGCWAYAPTMSPSSSA
jgi:hypothetical protein